MTRLLLIVLTCCVSKPSQAKSSQAIHSYKAHGATASKRQTPPKNWARWYLGASLILVENGEFQHIPVSEVSHFDQAVLLSDNSALSYNISEDQHDFIIDLGKSVRISRFFLNNKDAAGTFQLFACNTLEEIESQSWLKIGEQVVFERGVIPSITFAAVETRYLQVHFNIDSAGSIGNFGATGSQ